MKQAQCDVIVIGSGATGIWTARKLARRGLSVIVVEAGGVPEGVVDPGEASPDVYFARDDAPYSFPRNRPYQWGRVRGLGGRTFHWFRVCPRMSDLDFQAARLDGHGELWPLSYSELSPYYDEAEAALGVLGQPNHALHRLFKKRVEAHSKKIPVTVARVASGDFLGLLMPSVRSGRVSLQAGQRAIEIMTSRDGRRATGIVVVDIKTGKTREIRSRAVALCGSTIDSTWLLLNSKSRHYPTGLGNSSGLLGRYLMNHNTVECSGVVPESKGKTAFQEQASLSYIPRFQNLTTKDRAYIRGFATQITWRPCERIEGKSPCSFASRAPSFHRFHFHMLSFGEVLAKRENRVTLSATKRDDYGLPIPHIDFRYSENDLKIHRDQKRTLLELSRFAQLEILNTPKDGVPGRSMHEVGTSRMGSDPASSVLGPYSQSWDVLNVYVMDGSSFVSSGVQNPTLTMLALGGRACDHLARSLS